MTITNETLSKIEPLTSQKIWCTWKLEAKDGRQTKVPYQPNGIHAKSNNPQTWSYLSDVLAKQSFSGIGVFFNGKILGIDIDKVLVDGQIIDPTTVELLKIVNTYVELSPSGNGLHILFLMDETAELTRNKYKTEITSPLGKVEYEVYNRDRYFTFTGNEFAGCSQIRTIDQKELSSILYLIEHRTFDTKMSKSTSPTPSNPPDSETPNGVKSSLIDDKWILIKLTEIDKYRNFYFCNDADKNNDESSADMSLMCRLKYLTGDNKVQMKRLFLQSPRGKREKVSQRTDYIDLLIEASTHKCRVEKFYDWSVAEPQVFLKPKKLSEILQQEFEETDWLVEGLLVKSGSSILVSKPKVGKSLLARNLCMSVATGNRFLGKETKQGNVLYISLEESERNIRTHFVKMGATGEEAIYLVCAPGEYIPRAINALKDILEEFKPVLVVIDTLFRFIQVKDSNNYAEMTKAISPIIKLANEAGAHIMLIHHSRKADGDVGDSTLGSTAIFGSIETNMALQRTKDGLTLETSQRYGAPLPTTYITLNEESLTFALLETKKERQVRDISNEILDLLALQTAPITEKELMEDIHGDGTNKRSILNELVKNGLVSKEGKGIKGNPYKYSILNLDIYTGNENRESIEDVSAEDVRSEMIVKRSDEPLSADDK